MAGHFKAKEKHGDSSPNRGELKIVGKEDRRSYRCPFMDKRIGDLRGDGAFEMVCKGCRLKCKIIVEEGKITLNNNSLTVNIVS
jgi:hypothetical protein